MTTDSPESKRKSGGGKAGGGKLGRSETVTVRLDAKLRYLAELAALKQRRTLSSFIEWALEDSLGRVLLSENFDDRGTSVADASTLLWDVDDADRFAKLALHYPELLTHEEQKRWKLIRETGHVWKGRHDKVSGKWTWRVEEQFLVFDRLRTHWEAFCSVARGDATRDTLPQSSKLDPAKKPSVADFDDDIPF